MSRFRNRKSDLRLDFIASRVLKWNTQIKVNKDALINKFRTEKKVPRMIPSKAPVNTGKPVVKPVTQPVKKSEVTEPKKIDEKKTVGMSNADFRAKFFN